MLKKDNFFKNYFNNSSQYNKNLKKTKKIFKSFIFDLENYNIPFLQSYEKNYEYDFSNETVKKFGGIDNVINNASAISLTPTIYTEMKKFDLMFDVNVRGTFLVSKTCIPHLLKSENPHILNLSPPLDMDKKWFKQTLAYSMSKFGMSQCVLGMAEEFKKEGIAVNALWPHSVIATAAISNVVAGEEAFPHCRKPEILAAAAYLILSRKASEYTGNFCIDDVLLNQNGTTNFNKYRIDKNEPLWKDFFVPDDTPQIEPLVNFMNMK